MHRHTERLQKLIDLAKTMDHTYYFNELTLLKVDVDISILEAECEEIRRQLCKI